MTIKRTQGIPSGVDSFEIGKILETGNFILTIHDGEVDARAEMIMTEHELLEVANTIIGSLNQFENKNENKC